MADLGFFEHKTIDGDRWDLLAYHYYGDQYKQGFILEANRSLFLNPVTLPPLVLSAGLTLKIPVIDADEAGQTDLPPWKQDNPDYDL